MNEWQYCDLCGGLIATSQGTLKHELTDCMEKITLDLWHARKRLMSAVDVVEAYSKQVADLEDKRKEVEKRQRARLGKLINELEV